MKGKLFKYNFASVSYTHLKLRASYGIVGSQAICPYATMGLMSATAYNFGTNSKDVYKRQAMGKSFC